MMSLTKKNSKADGENELIKQTVKKNFMVMSQVRMKRFTRK
jgi:hypothetical protein